MKARVLVPVNTVDQAIRLARVLCRDLAQTDSLARRSYEVFAALTTDEREAIAAFLIWRARGKILKERYHIG